jgi:hypothetical protein
MCPWHIAFQWDSAQLPVVVLGLGLKSMERVFRGEFFKMVHLEENMLFNYQKCPQKGLRE